MGELYHVLNRGVDKREIFLEDADYFRFIHDLFEFNDENNTLNLNYFLSKKQSVTQSIDVRRRYLENRKPRKLLVEILAFCLMPNHYHLLLRARRENGIPLFMKKLNGGYAKYFNLKYERVGTLFQSRYKSVLIRRDAHFIHIPYYIHSNPLSLIEPGWQERKVRNCRDAIKFLGTYRWSSHLDYLGKENFLSVTQRKLLLDFFGGSQNYKKSFNKWVKDIDPERIEEIKYLMLD